jgi:hypothetical protein
MAYVHGSGLKVQRFKGSKVQGFKGSRVQRFKGYNTYTYQHIFYLLIATDGISTGNREL